MSPQFEAELAPLHLPRQREAKEIWLNLLDNAATQPGERNHKRNTGAASRADRLWLSLTRAAAVDAETLRRHIFEQFYQGTPATGRRATAWALPWHQKIAALHGGEKGCRGHRPVAAAAALRLF